MQDVQDHQDVAILNFILLHQRSQVQVSGS